MAKTLLCTLSEQDRSPRPSKRAPLRPKRRGPRGRKRRSFRSQPCQRRPAGAHRMCQATLVDIITNLEDICLWWSCKSGSQPTQKWQRQRTMHCCNKGKRRARFKEGRLTLTAPTKSSGSTAETHTGTGPKLLASLTSSASHAMSTSVAPVAVHMKRITKEDLVGIKAGKNQDALSR